jgi:nucleotide-binding universal stress UspA family protein
VKQLSRILAAVDFSEPARTAFTQALALARAHDAELTVVHAVPKDRPFRWRARERIALMAELRQTAEAAGVRFKRSVRHGDPAGVIVLHARARRPDVIVLGTHQRTGLDRLRAGSVAESVALRATQPVLIVPEGTVTSFDNVLAAVDFSAASNRTVEEALSFARGANGRVTLLHVVRAISPERASRYPYFFTVPKYHSLVVRDAWRRLQNAIPVNAPASNTVHGRVAIGDPPAEIARIAEDIDANLIVVGVTSSGGIRRRIFGTMAARMIRSAPCAVLAVPELEGWRSVPSQTDDVAIAA